MTGVTTAIPRQQFSNALGIPLAGGKLYTFLAGSNTPAKTFQDQALTIENENPITLDSTGSCTLWLDPDKSYKFVLKNALGVTQPGWPVDNVNASTSIFAKLVNLAASAGAALIGFLQQGTGAIVSTIQNELRRSYYVSQFETPAQAVIAAAGKRLFVEAGETLVLNVPAQFSTLSAAWAAIRGWVIHGKVQIKLADGVYSPGASILLNHPFGANIEIVGNVASPGSVVVMGPDSPAFDMFVISNGQQFGLIQGLRVARPTKATQAINCTAFLALNGASLTLDHCEADKFYYGVAARNGGVIRYNTGAVSNAGDVGVWAFAGGNIQCTNVQSNYAIDTEYQLGFGFQAEFGGVVEAQNCSATGCHIAGFAALSNGTGRYYNCTSNANVGAGFMSRGGGQIEANGSNSTNNTGFGIYITEYGNITGLGPNTGNTAGAASKFPYFDVSTGEARLTASVGNLRVDTNGDGSVFFNTAGGAQAEIRHAASAVNRTVLQGAPAGQPASVRADGTDEVIDLALYPKGAGSYVRFGAGYFEGSIVPTGYFALKLDDGSVVQVPCMK